MIRLLVVLFSIVYLSGCVTVNGLNEDFRKIDAAWANESSKYEAEQRHHKVNAGFEVTFAAVKQTYDDLGMRIIKTSAEKGFIISKNIAPLPLTNEQWQEVREVENPKLEEMGFWLISIEDDPSDYVVTIKAEVKTQGDFSTVNLDYFIEVPTFEGTGLVAPQHAAPHAVKLMSEMFWQQLDDNLTHAN
jgi:hypothetical protein